MMKHIMISAALALTGLAATANTAQAQTPFVGQVQGFGFNFCPRGWAPAAGQLYEISQHSTLYSLYGTMYGGDGVRTFAVPNLMGTRMVGAGTMPGGQTWQQGQRQGSTSHTLTLAEMPNHSHPFYGTNAAAAQDSPTGHTFATFSGVNAYADAGNNDVEMNPNIVGFTGGNIPFDISSPYLTITYCVALQGLFPSRN